MSPIGQSKNPWIIEYDAQMARTAAMANQGRGWLPVPVSARTMSTKDVTVTYHGTAKPQRAFWTSARENQTDPKMRTLIGLSRAPEKRRYPTSIP